MTSAGRQTVALPPPPQFLLLVSPIAATASLSILLQVLVQLDQSRHRAVEQEA